ncbi:MAG: outer membrane protein assembly factor BamE [Kangiellaceae bacterium]|nr:outer membrane protein assembly factor BamE [Kangiellaceae bacterium]
MKKIIVLTISLLVVAAMGCVYKPSIQQGNILDQKEVNKIEPGMTKSQITFILGNPVLNTNLDENTWYYLYYLIPSKGEKTEQRLVLHFDGDVLKSLEGTIKPEKEEE